ncbi:serine protease [Rhodanobacter sp. Soil772]|uniref:S1 family peptidase n=1 Tax=Rhodanobacter sp. Soil772 TaxID=1736406 RepID=UPI0009E9A09F|nr:serine protease [Rhodanobacter sp. Soil772]
MVPSNILQRTFRLLHRDATGTGFTFEVNRRQYLATARHVVEGLQTDSSIGVSCNGTWQQVVIGSVWLSPTGADVALLSLRQQLSPIHGVAMLGDGATFSLSQQAYFLGFPYGLQTEVGQLNNGYPIPFVKSGIVSSFSLPSGGSQVVYLDAINNPGFSGGPIVTISPNGEVVIVAVVSAYRYNEDKILLNGQDTGLTYRANTGLVIGYSVNELWQQAKLSADGVVVHGA